MGAVHCWRTFDEEIHHTSDAGRRRPAARDHHPDGLFQRRGRRTGSGGGGGDASKAKIGLLLPDSVTARYASADRPLFTADVKKQCAGCSVIYATPTTTRRSSSSRPKSMLTQGVKVLVLDPFDGEAAASIVAAGEGQGCPSSPTTASSTARPRATTSRSTTRTSASCRARPWSTPSRQERPHGSGIIMVNGSPTDNNAAQFKTGAHRSSTPAATRCSPSTTPPDWNPGQGAGLGGGPDLSSARATSSASTRPTTAPAAAPSPP